MCNIRIHTVSSWNCLCLHRAIHASLDVFGAFHALAQLTVVGHAVLAIAALDHKRSCSIRGRLRSLVTLLAVCYLIRTRYTQACTWIVDLAPLARGAGYVGAGIIVILALLTSWYLS